MCASRPRSTSRSLARRDAQRAQYVASAREAIDPGMMPERRARHARYRVVTVRRVRSERQARDRREPTTGRCESRAS
ncbi:hypothetical protein WS71_19805 [Burkholderia mayonis]|uniref:Uncharacterized protein n=1 Tax=Burkholderia mayonis TaxID=1385591 RepID=A0A1B4G0Y5_9BURK|nr:hypothetical protein WS71_19805 [Burkholderia mayonis]KVE52189.1 hypothetical protein WS71_09630 [Burkholderia mayonis]